MEFCTPTAVGRRYMTMATLLLTPQTELTTNERELLPNRDLSDAEDGTLLHLWGTNIRS